MWRCLHVKKNIIGLKEQPVPKLGGRNEPGRFKH